MGNANQSLQALERKNQCIGQLNEEKHKQKQKQSQNPQGILEENCAVCRFQGYKWSNLMIGIVHFIEFVERINNIKI